MSKTSNGCLKENPSDSGEHGEKEKEGAQEATNEVVLKTCAFCGTVLGGEKAHECQHRDALIGTIIGDKYEIVQLLGKGGMSVVYKAKDIVIGRFVAIKMLLMEAKMNTKDLLRFQQEARAAGQLDHPNIIKIYEMAVPDEGRPYLVMDYIEGQSLADLLAEPESIGWHRSLAILIEVCQALQHAHQKGVVHRDLKPSNIMLTRDFNGKEVVKLVDFGIAKLHAASDEKPQLTKSGDIFGSPLYMSPEQCDGRSTDRKTDVYAFGCVMYEVFAGHPPFVGMNSLETMLMQLNESPRLLSETKSQLPSVRKLDLIILKALAKDPNQRFASMAEVQEALELLSGKQRSDFWGRIADSLKMRRSRQAAGKQQARSWLLMAFVMSTIVALIVTVVHFRQSPPLLPLTTKTHAEWQANYIGGQNALNRKQFDLARKQFLRCLTIAETEKASNPRLYLLVTQQMIDLCSLESKTSEENYWLSEWQATKQAAGKANSDRSRRLVNALTAQRESSQDANLGGTKRICAEALAQAQYCVDHSEFVDARDLLDAVESLARAKCGANSTELAKALYAKGVLERRFGDFTSAIKNLRAALTIAKAGGGNVIDWADCTIELAAIMTDTRSHRNAHEVIDGLIKSCQENDLNPQAVARCKKLSGEIYLQDQNFPAAKRELSQAQELFSRTLPAPAEVAACKSALAIAMAHEGQRTQAFALSEEAVDLLQSQTNVDDLDALANALRSFSTICANDPDHQVDEITVLERVISLRRRACAPLLLNDYSRLGIALDKRGMKDAADQVFMTGLRYEEKAKHASKVTFAGFLVTIARHEYCCRHLQAAELYCQSALKLLEKSNNADASAILLQTKRVQKLVDRALSAQGEAEGHALQSIEP